ncbi:MAG: thioredoxin-disulfide reductase [Syntrophales bacterium]|jgi:thioredoxin reductase (NADPH)|nr:thioredoxin-disulfide reductase [Syntrophales bacterium]MCK9527182.1 thioredoxin-disulfide reductase [Syntrophales bacterium]MDX9921693.1 thioredoxin-disulfide reductase [Syntrophales bacterium]
MNDSTIPDDVFDCLIIGAGPAGLTAALYTSRSAMKTLVLEGSSTVSQVTVTDIVENYPGIPEVNGFELHHRLRTQALSFGAEARAEDVLSLEKTSLGAVEGWTINTNLASYRSLSVIVASGARWRSLGVPGEEEFIGRGVSYCATCDGPFYRNRSVAVVGGGNTAVQEALYLTKFADRVTIVHRRDRLRASAILQERASANSKIDFCWDGVVDRIEGDTGVTRLRVKKLKGTDAYITLPVEGVFIFIGLDPLTDFIRGLVTTDGGGYIVTDSQMRTSERGLFAAGDCVVKPFRQIVTACGDGATAAYQAELYVDELRDRSY